MNLDDNGWKALNQFFHNGHHGEFATAIGLTIETLPIGVLLYMNAQQEWALGKLAGAFNEPIEMCAEKGKRRMPKSH